MTIKHLGILSLLMSSNILTSATPATTAQIAEPNIYQTLAALHLPALAQQKEQEAKVAQEIALENKEAYKINPKKITIRELGEAEKLELYYKIFGLKAPATSTKKLLNDNVPYDLELLSGSKPDFERHIFGVLDRTITTAGKIALQKRLCQPLNDIAQLEATQNIVRTLTTDTALTDKLMPLLTQIKETEGELAWFFKELEEEVKKYFETVYFAPSFFGDYTEYNKNATAMQGLAAWNVSRDAGIIMLQQTGGAIYGGIVQHLFMGPLQKMFFPGMPEKTLTEDIVDQLIFKFNPMPMYHQANTMSPILGNVTLGLWAFDKVMLAYQLKIAITKGLENLAIMQRIEQKMVLISTLVNACEQVADCISNSSIAADYKTLGMPAEHYGSTAQKTKSPAFDAAVKPLHPSQAPLFTKGKAMAGFKLVDSAKLSLIDKLSFIGLVDSHLATAKLFTEHVNKPATYCFPVFLQANRPAIELVNYWHPFLNPETVVTNTIALGNGVPQTIVITGPNAGGKSTSLKAIMYATLLAQSLSIAPAQSMALTPFGNLDTYLNIADTEGRESLFQAEMKRTKGLIQTVQKLDAQQFSFVIMDEIFSGTNPKEGMAGAYGVAMKLASIPNSLTIIATHFIELTQLAETSNATANYKVSIKRENDKIVPLYKLEPGITDQNIAIDLLAEAGFDADIVAAANAMMLKKAAR